MCFPEPLNSSFNTFTPLMFTARAVNITAAEQQAEFLSLSNKKYLNIRVEAGYQFFGDEIKNILP